MRERERKRKGKRVIENGRDKTEKRRIMEERNKERNVGMKIKAIMIVKKENGTER